MKGFINPSYPMSNREMEKDSTWGGAHPRLRPGWLFPKGLLPRVLPDRPGYIGTTRVDDEIVKVDTVEASTHTGSPGGYIYDPPEYRFLTGDWRKRVAKMDEVSRSHDPHPLHRQMKSLFPGEGFKMHMARAGVGPVNPEKTEVEPVVFSRAVKQFAYDFGAEAAGITEINRNWVYLEEGQDPLPAEYTHVLIFAYRHPPWRIRHSPAYTSDIGSWVAYHFTSFLAVEIADWIRQLGYEAKANAMLTGYDIMMPPHEVQAGLGEQCRIGVNLHPVLGPAYKVGAVLTSLPMITDRPIEFNLESFCEKCEKCARECPPNAIPKGREKKINTRGVTKWQVDTFRCKTFWTLDNRYQYPHAHDACAQCIYVCPWTKHNAEKWQHRMIVAMVSNFKWMQKPAIWGDDLAGYGKQAKADQSWERWF